MEQEINKAIDDFAKGNKDLAKILALFSAKVITIFGKGFLTEFSDKMLKMSDGLMAYYDINLKDEK